MPATKLKIRLYGDPCLRKRSAEVKDVGPSERMLIGAMIATMHQAKGIGLAAPQVGINQRIFVADVGDGPRVFINPKIVKKGGSETLEEGCLSIPQVTVNVKRAKKINVKYLNEQNQPCEGEFQDILARVIQHESDHLNGKMIVDYASLTKKVKIKKKLRDIKKGIITAPLEGKNDTDP